jgi:hypothetical protein
MVLRNNDFRISMFQKINISKNRGFEVSENQSLSNTSGFQNLRVSNSYKLDFLNFRISGLKVSSKNFEVLENT